MDALSALGMSLQQVQAMADTSASRIASAGLPSAIVPDVTSGATAGPATPSLSNNVDVAQQLTTMMASADSHHLSAAVMRVALSMYQDSVQLVNTDS
jgi:hypothetical protein